MHLMREDQGITEQIQIVEYNQNISNVSHLQQNEQQSFGSKAGLECQYQGNERSESGKISERQRKLLKRDENQFVSDLSVKGSTSFLSCNLSNKRDGKAQEKQSKQEQHIKKKDESWDFQAQKIDNCKHDQNMDLGDDNFCPYRQSLVEFLEHIKAKNLPPVMLNISTQSNISQSTISLDKFLKKDSPIQVSLFLVRQLIPFLAKYIPWLRKIDQGEFKTKDSREHQKIYDNFRVTFKRWRQTEGNFDNKQGSPAAKNQAEKIQEETCSGSSSSQSSRSSFKEPDAKKPASPLSSTTKSDHSLKKPHQNILTPTNQNQTQTLINSQEQNNDNAAFGDQFLIKSNELNLNTTEQQSAVKKTIGNLNTNEIQQCENLIKSAKNVIKHDSENSKKPKSLSSSTSKGEHPIDFNQIGEANYQQRQKISSKRHESSQSSENAKIGNNEEQNKVSSVTRTSQVNSALVNQ